MFDQLVDAIIANPYLAVAVLFVLCGLGFPLPEEIVLLAAGYVCHEYPSHAQLPWMMLWCGGAILVGDAVPYVLGRVFGVRLLRVRYLRLLVTKQRLANFDRWFRRRGDWVILIARFIPGLRVVAFFTAGTMKMSWQRFLCLDGLGILMIVPLLTWIGFQSAGFIGSAIETVQKVEKGILWTALAGGVVLALWYWVWRRSRRRVAPARPTETFVQPTVPVQEPPDCPPASPAGPSPDAGGEAPRASAEPTPPGDRPPS